MTTTTREIDDYVTAVHAALADLPDDEREELLDDLPQHLADVQADRSGSLVALLGAPEAYAAELRATAGLEPSPGTRSWLHVARERLTDADTRLGAALGYERFADLVRALAPGWWVVRGWLIAEFLTGATGNTGRWRLVPAIGGNWVVGIALLVVAVFASVWFGRRARPRAWQRVVLTALGVALAIYGVVLVHHATESRTYYVSDSSDGTDGADSISNIYPVGPDGSVLRNIRLYDQDGNPVQFGDPSCPDGTYFQTDPDGSGQQIYTEPLPAATSAASADGANIYPLTCDTAQGPFRSAHPPALPVSTTAAPSSGAPSSPTTSSAAPSSPAPSASPSTSARR